MTESDPTDRAERAFRAALAGEAEVFEPVPLDASATRRRRHWSVLGAAAAAACAVALTAVGLAAVTGPGDQEPRPAEPSDTRTVTFRDLAVDVPASWGDAYAPESVAWCIDRPKSFSTAPYVALETSGMAIPAILCVPDEEVPEQFPPVDRRLWAPHLSLGHSELAEGLDGQWSHDGWTLTRTTFDDITLVLLTDAATTPLVEQILASVRRVEADANGCDTTSPAQAREFVRPSPAFDITDVDEVTEIAVCKYDRGATAAPRLLGSRVLTGAAAQSEIEAIKNAPAGGGPDRPAHCASDLYGDTALVLRLRNGDTAVGDVYVYYDWCFGNGFDDGTTRRAITADNCSPLWGERLQLEGASSHIFRLCEPSD